MNYLILYTDIKPKYMKRILANSNIFNNVKSKFWYFFSYKNHDFKLSLETLRRDPMSEQYNSKLALSLDLDSVDSLNQEFFNELEKKLNNFGIKTKVKLSIDDNETGMLYFK